MTRRIAHGRLLALPLLALAMLAGVSAQDAPPAADEAPQAPAPASDGDAPAEETAAPVEHAYFDLRRDAAVPGDIEAGRVTAQLCATCHGPTGAASVAPMIPDLAGQKLAYLYWEMLEYKRGTLTESPMTVLMGEVTKDDIRNLASFYASQTPDPPAIDDSQAPPDPALLARGEQLYLHGDPAKGIPPCQGCHGADAEGHPRADWRDENGHQPYAAYPALRSQRDVYLQSRLAAFREGKLRYSTTDFVMTGIGERLDDDSVNALAAWLSRLPPRRTTPGP